MIELIIGREGGVDNPRLAITQGDQTVFYGAPGSVPKTVSRKHCKVTVDDNGFISFEDITENNFTFINGLDCKIKGNVGIHDVIELGSSRYRLDLDSILKSLSSKQAFSVKHLEAVYSKYQKDKLDMQVRQGKLNAISALPGILSMTSIGIAVFLPSARIVMIAFAAVFALVFAFIRYKNASKTPLKSRSIEESFRENYVCPNPACNRFLGATPYKELLKNRSCPYCKAQYFE